MTVGLLTAPFGSEDLDFVLRFAAESHFDALEIATGPGSRHIDTASFTEAQAEQVKRRVADAGLTISSLALYNNVTAADPKERQANGDSIRRAVDIAAALGVDVVCTMAGFPVPGKDKMKTIEEDCAEVYPPLLEHAKSRGVKLAMENWFETNIQHLGHFQRIFEVIPHDNFGLNFDPSHLVHQGIDYLAAVDRFKDRIFHSHAKDTEIDEHHLRWYGNRSGGWWRYVIPGYGVINWGVYIARLRRNGYNGVLSIEHEDGALGREEGFIKGLNYLRTWA